MRSLRLRTVGSVAFSILCSAAAWQLAAAQGSPSSTSGAPVSVVTIKAAQDSVKAGTPVGIIVTVKNTSDHDIELKRLLSGADSRIDVRDTAGNLPKETNFGYFRNGHVVHPELDESRLASTNLGDEAVAVIVKAGQTVTWGIYVSKFYDMSKPGKYAIQIERGDLGDPTLTVKSNVITVTVTVP